VALAFLLCQDFPVFPIVGCRTVEQLDSSLGAATLRLELDEVDYLSDGRRSRDSPA